MMLTKIIKNSVAVLLIFVFSIVLKYENAQAIKIVAVVNEGVVTDFDVNEFERVLCKFDKRFKCGSQDSRQMAMYSLIESTLKLEHFKQIDFGADKDNIMKGFEDYKKNVLKNLKIPSKNVPKSFLDYLYAEYIWGIVVPSQIKQSEITEQVLDDFAKIYNIKEKDYNKLKAMYIQYKSMEISQKTLAEMKKFYLVDIKGL